MIYLIDDKSSRQKDFGWNEEAFSKYKDYLRTIRNSVDMIELNNKNLQENDVVLYHESFLSSNDKDKLEIIHQFQDKLKSKDKLLFIAYFSGSKNGRFTEERKCMLPPSVLYENLDLFIQKYIIGDINLKYLAFGENWEIEKILLNRIIKVNEDNVDFEKVNTNKEILFASTSEEPVESPFANAIIPNDWDFFNEDVTDDDLSELINNWFGERKFDIVCIPLCFGKTFSDFMGLRLAMHIRLSNTPNQLVPICIYGEALYEETFHNECFDVLKMSNIHLVSGKSRCIVDMCNKCLSAPPTNFPNDIRSIHINIPSNFGDNHSVANKWAIYRWTDMIEWKGDNPEILDSKFLNSLYFKYLVTKFGIHDKFKKSTKYPSNILGIQNKKIAYIDDEYDKGWENILQKLFSSNGADFICFKDFDKKIKREELIKKIKEFVKSSDADCYILDLRLHEEDFSQRNNLSGHEVANYIKKLNPGNQIVVFTASDKVWNLKEELIKIGAVGYALKESPELHLNRDASRGLYVEFVNTVKLACKMSYLKDLVSKQRELEAISNYSCRLNEIINLLSLDNGKNSPNILNASLLIEIVFLEDYIKEQLGYKLISLGKGATKKVELCIGDKNQYELTGHLFFKREETDKYFNVIEVSNYMLQSYSPFSGWCNVSVSDVTLIAASLLIIFKLPINSVQQYITHKFIRNTQIAHNGGNEKTVTIEMIVDFYNNVLYPVFKYTPTK